MDYKVLNTVEEVKNRFLEEYPVIPGNVNNPFLILFDGYIGSGKSTVARSLSKHIEIIPLINDMVRQFVYSTGLDSSLYEKTVKLIQDYRLLESIKTNNCLIDGNISNNYGENFINRLKFYEDNNIKYYIVKVTCDEDIILKRVKNRQTDFINNFSEASTESAFRSFKNKKEIPIEYVYYEIDTSKDIDDVDRQVKELLIKIKGDNYVEHR